MSQSTHYLSQPRIEPGLRTGGQWTATAHGASSVALGTEPPDSISADRAVLAARRRRLANRQTGYVEATAVRTGENPRMAGEPATWWDTHFVTAEYGAAGGDYRQMPDDFTPRGTGGHALSGRRRTHRMAYRSPDGSFAIRMPSATSVKAFEQQTGSTFDVPVSAVSADGRTVSGWVRVTRSGNTWAVTELGEFGPSGVEVSEAVSCILEARRPTRALAQAGDLRRRRADRVAANGVTVVPVSSGFIDTIAYDKGSGLMGVTIRGKTYGYQVPESAFDAVRGDRSPGRAYNKLVKGRPRMAVCKCPQCGRFSSATIPHACPLGHRERSGNRFAHNDAARVAAARFARAATPAPDTGVGSTPAGSPTAAPIADPERIRPVTAEDLAAQVRRAMHQEGVGDRTMQLRLGTHQGRPAVAVVLTDHDGTPSDSVNGTPAVQLFAVTHTEHGTLLGPLVATRSSRPGAPVSIGVTAAHPHGPEPAGTEHVDLAGLLNTRRPGARPQRTTRDGAPTGWTRNPEVTGALGRYTSSRYVPHLYGNRVGNGHYGIIGFDGVGGSDAQRLLAALPVAVADRRFRPTAPTVGDLLRAAAANPGRVEVGGYTTHPDNAGGDLLRAECAHVYDVREGEGPDEAWERVSRDYRMPGGDPAQAQVVTVPWSGRRAWRFSWA